MYKNFSQDFWLVGLARGRSLQVPSSERGTEASSPLGFVFVHFSILQVFPKILRSSRAAERPCRLRIAENPNVRDLVIIGLRLGLILLPLDREGHRVGCWVVVFFWIFFLGVFFIFVDFFGRREEFLEPRLVFLLEFCYFRFLQAENFYSKGQRNWLVCF